LKSVVLPTLVLLVVEACGGGSRTALSRDDAGPAMGDDDGGVGSACGAPGESCCALEGVLTCSGGLACVRSVCERPSAADAGDARPAGDADTGAPGVRPAAQTVAIGADHACVLRGGKVKCWGLNWRGELGTGVNTGPESCAGFACSTAPVAVTGLSAPVESVAAGGDDTCVLLEGGAVACWGTNDSGQLGDGSASGPDQCPDPCSTTPVVVSGLSGATAVATSGDDACAVLSSGAVECWGSNVEGELGNGTIASGDPGGSPVPTRVSGLTQATAVALGGGYACALLLDGTIRCWGSNSSGQLGNGSTTDSTTPVPVSHITSATAVAAGAFHTCALMADGTVECWGGNYDGELGLGTSSGPQTCSTSVPCATTPVKVPTLSRVTAIATGENDTCALLADGTVRCWGWNLDGELGDGTTTDSPTPVVVSGLSGATAITMGDETACALVASGDVLCWGNNTDGQLASAPTGPQTCSGGNACSPTPVTISGL
jgi:alpha-tubulin suppressor-like RCC1 family protein